VVLGIHIRRKALVAGLMTVAAATAAFGDDRAALADTTLILLSDRTACRVVHMTADGDAVLRLPLSGLCTFHRDAAGAMRIMETEAGPVFLIETSALQTGSTQDCDTQVLALRLTPEGLAQAPAAARVASCLPYQWDDAMFLGAF
jgi:hypothetical protein